MKPSKKPLRHHVGSYLTRAQRKEALVIPLSELPEWTEAQLELKKLKWSNPPGKVLARKLRPYCVALRVDGEKCGAKQAWDKKNNCAIDGYCMKHSPSYVPEDKKPSD